MLDYVKELVSAANSRVRSPVLGSVAVVFFALNWKEIFYVFFAETSVQVRLSYFEVNTDNWSLIYWPLIIGGALSFLYPWITLTSSQLAKFPVRALKTMQGEEDIMRQIRSLKNEVDIENARAELEEARADVEKENEGRLLAAANRLKEAEKISPSAAEDLRKNRDEHETETSVGKPLNTQVKELDLIGIVFLLGLAKNKVGEGALKYESADRRPDSMLSFAFANDPDATVFLGKHRRVKLRAETVLEEMTKLKLIESLNDRGGQYVEFQITERGYEASDAIELDFDQVRLDLNSVNQE